MAAEGDGEPPAGYTPTMPDTVFARIRERHGAACLRGAAEFGGRPHGFEYLSRTIVVPPRVFPITPVSHLLGEAVLAEVRDGDRVLGMGTGSGVNAILAASRSREVVAVDVNPHTRQAASDNAARNGVADRVEVRDSDVFGNVDGRFDLIIFDPPFRWFGARDVFERATADENYRALTRFFRNASRHLNPGGRMLISFGTSGDLDYLHRLSAETGFDTEVVASLDTAKDGHLVTYSTFRRTTS